MKTNSSVLSGKFWLAAVTVALFLLPVTAAAQAGNSGRDRRGNISPGRFGVTTVGPGEKLDLNAKLRIRSGGFFLENTALLRAGRGRREIPSSPPFAAVELGTENASDYLVFKAGGVERARISIDGNVGIGTTNPTAKLDVAGTAQAQTLGVNSGNYSGSFYWGNSSFAVWYMTGSDYSSSVRFKTWDGSAGYSDKVTFQNDGKVGIGTTSPLSKLHVKAATNDTVMVTGHDALSDGIRFIGVSEDGNTVKGMEFHASPFYFRTGNVGIGTSAPSNLLHVSTGSTAIAAPTPTIQIHGNRTGWGNVNAKLELIIGGSNTADKVYLGLDTSAASTRALTIQGDGNVGIGTTSPSTLLSLGDGSASSNPVLTLNGGTNSGKGAGIALRRAGANAIEIGFSSAVIGDNNNDAVFYTNGSGAVHRFYTSGVERLRIDSSGNVGIGTPSPGSRLDIRSSTSGANLTSVNSATSGTNYGLDVGATGTGGASNVGGFFTASGATANKAIYINGVSASSSNYALYSDAAAKSYFAGDVGIGTTTPGQKLDIVGGNINVTSSGGVGGDITITGTINARYQDVAEWVPSSEQLAAGTVVVLDSTKSNQVISSSVSYDTRVAGVISAQPGIALGEKSDSKVLVATTGRVKVKVDASKGAIHIGDLLVTSDVPGVAMKSEAVNLGGVQFHRPGTLIGKALDPLEKGSGEILVLLSLQ